MIMMIGMWLPHSGLASSLGFTELPTLYWPILLVTLLCYIVLTQVMKTILLRRDWI
jgi:Mg2+-importing ATPase